MTKHFTFESNHFTSQGLCNTIKVVLDIRAKSEDDYWHEIESITDLTANVERDLLDFSLVEQKMIEDKCEGIAYDYGHEAYQDYLIMLADRYYED